VCVGSSAGYTGVQFLKRTSPPLGRQSGVYVRGPFTRRVVSTSDVSARAAARTIEGLNPSESRTTRMYADGHCCRNRRGASE